jgi:hypothetical protein
MCLSLGERGYTPRVEIALIRKRYKVISSLDVFEFGGEMVH